MASRSNGVPVVLVAEDDADQAEWTREILADGGFQAVLALNGAQALELLDVVRPDLVVTDMVMPELDGLGFLRGLAGRPEPRPPAVAVSSMASYLPEALRLGARAALQKPLDDGLLETLRGLLARGPEHPPRPPPPALDERRRLEAIHRLRLDQPAPGTALRAFVQRVARVFDVPVCLVSIITDTRQYWTAACGVSPELEEQAAPRDRSFCAHSVAARSPLVVQDALVNPVFRDNFLVRHQGLRFYAGTPLIERRGEALGTLCLLDFRERPAFGRFDLELLEALSTRVLAELEWREREERPREPLWAFRHLGCYDPELGILGRDAFMAVVGAQSGRLAPSRRPLTLVAAAVPEGLRAQAVELLEDRFDTALFGRLGLDRIAAVVPGHPVDEVEDQFREVIGGDGLVLAIEAAGSPLGSEARLWHLETSLGSFGLGPVEGPPAREAFAGRVGLPTVDVGHAP